MRIEFRSIAVRDLVAGYRDYGEGDVLWAMAEGWISAPRFSASSSIGTSSGTPWAEEGATVVEN